MTSHPHNSPHLHNLSHLHTYMPSHPHAISTHTFSPSHPHALTLSHPHALTPSRSHALTHSRTHALAHVEAIHPYTFASESSSSYSVRCLLDHGRTKELRWRGKGTELLRWQKMNCGIATRGQLQSGFSSTCKSSIRGSIHDTTVFKQLPVIPIHTPSTRGPGVPKRDKTAGASVSCLTRLTTHEASTAYTTADYV